MKRRDPSQKGASEHSAQSRGDLSDSRTHARNRKNKKRPSSRLFHFLKVSALVGLSVYITVPFVIRLFPALLAKVVYLNALKVPFFVDLKHPGEILNHTSNFYLTPEDGVTVGIWHTVPANRGEEARGKGHAWYETALSDGNPVIIYLHGNGGTRAVDHRIQLVKILSAAGFHVLSLDYRGYADSTGEASEDGMTKDSMYLYEWVKARSRGSPVCFWGHSLGTGVATNAARKLQEKGTAVDAVILEAPYTNIREAGLHHPFGKLSDLDCGLRTGRIVWRAEIGADTKEIFMTTVYKIYHIFPAFEYFFIDTMSLSNLLFPNDENVKVLTSPLLILHAEDDFTVPSSMARKLHEIALNSQNSRHVKLVLFPTELGYQHKFIYKDPKLPEIIWAFLNAI